jgi:hypothetical protein
MSTTSLATTTTAPKHELRRPPSVQSLGPSRGAQAAPSLKPLYQTLLHHSTPSADGIPPVPVLPQEAQVLSTLLSPFLNADKAVRVDEDRWFAFEAFDIIVKTWNPPTDVRIVSPTATHAHSALRRLSRWIAVAGAARQP